MIDPASFKIRFPEFATEQDARIQIFIDDSAILLNSVFWGEKYDIGLSYLTAHYLTVANKSEAGSINSIGPMTGKSVDGVSVNFATTTTGNASDDFLSSTIYGQRYLAMRKTLGVAATSI